jgi:putative PIN family toxin of toxin-antitoxin system
VTPPPRVVLDTNVLVSSLIAEGSPRQIVEECRSGKTILILSEAILTELGEVMRRRFVWEPGQVVVLLQELRSCSLVVTPVSPVSRIQDDAADNRVLECALEGHADYIVSGDTRHLQPLGSFNGIPILSPAAFVNRVH